jgi:hypothetical protein
VTLPPSEALLWAEIELEPSLRGKALAVAYKLPEVVVELTLADGRTVAYRFIPPMARAGFLLSPLVENLTQFLELASPHASHYAAGRRAVALMVTAIGPRAQWAWRPTFRLRIHELSLPVQPVVDRFILDIVPIDGREMAAIPGGDCFFDVVREQPFGRFQAAASRLEVRGWAVVSGRDGIAPQTIVLTLTDEQGARRFYPVEKEKRIDVNRYFGRPEMTDVGFHDWLDIAGLSGRLSIAAIAVYQESAAICPIERTVTVGQ